MVNELPDSVCPYCRKVVGFQSGATMDVQPAHVNKYIPRNVDVQLLECLNPQCGQSALVLENRKTAEVRLVYPAPVPRVLPNDVPESVRSCFEEASLCEQAGTLRAAGVMYRSAVEAMCDELGVPAEKPNGGFLMLNDRIKKLPSKNVSQEIIDGMNEVKLVGNWSVHAKLGFAPDELADIASLIEEAAMVLWVQPAERKRMADAREARRIAHSTASAAPPAATSP